MRTSILAATLIGLMFQPSARLAAAPDPDFGAYWHDGKAELDGYRLIVQRYGHPRRARGVMIYVTEPFSRSKHVKLDDPSTAPGDALDVLKLNLVRDFQTGIYDYHTVVSLFVSSDDFSPVKVAFSNSEWCGQVYEELNFTGSTVSQKLSSYFEGESTTSRLGVPPGGVQEDNLFILLRGLRGTYLKPGERRTVPFLASPFYRRLAHRPMDWTTATIERIPRPATVTVPAGSFATDVYRVRPADRREGHFYVERSYPHRMVRWVWKPAAAGNLLGATDSGELTGSTRLEYWKTHDPGDESYLKRLGLEPAVK